MQAELALYDGPEMALKAAVMALGGAKKVGLMLWPSKSAESANNTMLDCVNPGRAAKLDYTEIIFVLRAARDVGCYAPFQWFAAECGFDANPVTKAEEEDRIVSVIADTSKTLASAMAMLERMQRARAVA